MQEKIFTIVPANNEEKHIEIIVKKATKFSKNVIVVDDGSKDNTAKIAKDNGATVLTHIVNLGKGSALKTGCDYAIKEGAEKIIVIDADLQHDPEDIPRFLESLNKNDVVLSYREEDKSMPVILKFGNWFINQTIKYLYSMKIKDSQCGYRAFTKEAYKKLRWKSTDYSLESEMIARIGNHKLKYVEIPIKTVYSDKYKGTTMFDGIKIVINLILWKVIKL